MQEFNEHTDFEEDNPIASSLSPPDSISSSISSCSGGKDSNIIECYLRELMNNVNFFTLSPINDLMCETNTSDFNLQSRRLTERRRSSITPDMNGNERFRSRYKSFSFDHLSSMVQDLFVAGTETISNTLDWAFLYVTYYPDIQKELADEIERVLGRGKLPTESDRFKLPLVEAFLNETMCFHCAGPILIPRSTTQNVFFKGYQIPENTFIMVNMWSCMRDPIYWNEPNRFNPKRFIDKDGKFCCKNPAMMPFSIGKRACTGEALARLQLFLIFTSILQKFMFSFGNEKDFKKKDILLGITGIGLKSPDMPLKLTLR